MADPDTIRRAFRRGKKAVSLRPSTGQSTAVTRVQVENGTTCRIQHGDWSLTADVGKAQGGNDAGPGPGILERAALGSCLAIGYATWAAHLEVPVTDIKVEVESDFDARGMYGIEDQPAGFTRLRYRVTIESPAPAEEIQHVVEEADAHSPVLDDFQRDLPVESELTIRQTEDQGHGC